MKTILSFMLVFVLAVAARGAAIQQNVLTTNTAAVVAFGGVVQAASTINGWDTIDNKFVDFLIGANLSYDHATHTLSATGGGGGSGIDLATLFVGMLSTNGSLVTITGIPPASIYGTLTNNTTGNAATATLASFVSGVLSNSITGNAATATLTTNAINSTNFWGLLSLTNLPPTVTTNNATLSANFIMQGNGARGVTNLAIGSGLSSDGTTLIATGAGLVPDSRTITIAGTANQITSSAGAQDLSANRTWTLSMSSSYVAPQATHTTNADFATVATNAINSTNLWGLLSLTNLPVTVDTNNGSHTTQTVQVGNGGRGMTNSSMTIDSDGNVAGISVPSTNLASATLQSLATNNAVTLTNVQTTNITVNYKAPFSTNFTATLSGLHLLCTGTNQLITLPSAATAGLAIPVHCSTTTGSVLVTNSNGSQLIGGALSFAVGAESAITLFSDGTNWHP